MPDRRGANGPRTPGARPIARAERSVRCGAGRGRADEGAEPSCACRDLDLGPERIDVRALFEALGAAGASWVVTTCGSGVNACHNALAMRVAGLPDPLLSPGSYSDWTQAGLPVATGDEPGEVPPGLG